MTMRRKQSIPYPEVFIFTQNFVGMKEGNINPPLNLPPIFGGRDQIPPPKIGGG